MEHILFYMYIFLDTRSEEKLALHAHLLLAWTDGQGVNGKSIKERFILQRLKQDPIPWEPFAQEALY